MNNTATLTDIMGIDDIDSYIELEQYTTWVATHKKPIEDDSGNPIKDDEDDLSSKTIISRSSYSNKFAVGVKAFTFSEFVKAIRDGHNLKRIGPKYMTRFLVIDLDNDFGENVTPEELDSFCRKYNAIHWTVGGSGRAFRYHIFVFLKTPIFNKQECEELTRLVLKHLSEHIGREVTPDEHQYEFLQWCYGTPQVNQSCMKEEILPGTLYRCRQITKKNGFMTVKVDPSKPDSKVYLKNTKKSSKLELIPYTTPMLANRLTDGRLRASKYEDGCYVNPLVYLEGKRFDITEPRVRKRLVPQGYRFLTAQAFIMRIVPQFFRCLEYGLVYSDEDLTNTFQVLCMRNFCNAEAWWEETGVTMVDGLLSELHSNDDLDYKDIEAKYTSSHSRNMYKRRGYSCAATMEIINNYAVASDDESTVILASTQQRDELLEEYNVQYQSFMRYAALLGYRIVYADDKRHSHKYDYIQDMARETDGVYYYVNAHDAEKSYCKRQDPPIKYNSYFSVFSGSREQYNAIKKEAHEAYLAMKAFFDKQDSENKVVNKVENEDWDIPDDLPFSVDEDPNSESEDSWNICISIFEPSQLSIENFT